MTPPNHAGSHLDVVGRSLLFLGAFGLPISIVLGQVFLYASLLVFLIQLVVERRSPGSRRLRHCFRSTLTPCIALFLLAVLVSIFVSVEPERSARKIYRFLMFLMVFALPFWFRDRRSDWPKIFAAYVAGCVVLVVFDVFRVRAEMDAGTPLAFTGNMRDPQFFMVGTLALTVFITMARDGYTKLIGGTFVAYCIIGLLLHQKRGTLLALGATIVIFGLISRRFKPILVLGVIMAGVLFFHSPTRDRLMQLPEQFGNNFGGRMTLWKQIGPDFVADHPWGAGFKATSYELFESYRGDHHIEAGLDHLHNNAYQMLAELGWFGLFTWLPLMAAILWALWRRRRSPPILVALLAFIALMINGLVEYNFGDSEIFMLMCLLMGFANLPAGELENDTNFG